MSPTATIRSLDSFKEFKKHGFFAPYSMKIHWLSKVRYGFPHQAHTTYRERSLGKRYNSARVSLSKTSREYCEKLMTLEAKFVIVPRDITECMPGFKKIKFWPYDQLNKSDKISLDTRNLAVYFNSQKF